MTPRFGLERIDRQFRAQRGGQSIAALCQVTIDIAPGEIVAVVGPNGSGKSTLLETMAFLEPPTTGRVWLDGCDVWAQKRSLWARRRCPLLLQKSLLFRGSVMSNVAYPLRLRGTPRHEARRRAAEMLARLGLESLAARGPGELSGGEQRRVALARLLALRPDTLLLDEPTAHVDRENEQVIEAVLREMHRESGMTIVLASHSRQQAERLAARPVVLEAGRLCADPVEVGGEDSSSQ